MAKKVSLVLGSGGARGMAHIGVIRCLEDQGYEISTIAGASIGALVGGLLRRREIGSAAKLVVRLGTP